MAAQDQSSIDILLPKTDPNPTQRPDHGDDVPSLGTPPENPCRVPAASLYVEGRSQYVANPPPVRWRCPDGTTKRVPGPKHGLVKLPEKPRTGTTAFDTVSSRSHTRDLSFEQFEIGVPPIPLESADVERLRESISLVGQTTAVLVRELPDGRLVLLDGWGRVEALRSIGRTMVSATILSGLSDQEARLKQIVSNHRKKLSVLDRAREDFEFLQIVRERVSQDATPVGGRQPTDKCHAKAAKELKVSADRVARSERIARILPEAQTKIRELNLQDKQSALLRIADAGDTAELQIMKAIELSRPPAPTQSVGATAAPDTSAAEGNDAEMPEIPAFLRRDKPAVSSDQIRALAASEAKREGQGGADQSDARGREEVNAVEVDARIQFGVPPSLGAKLDGLADGTRIRIVGFVRAVSGGRPRIEVQDITALSGSDEQTENEEDWPE